MFNWKAGYIGAMIGLAIEYVVALAINDAWYKKCNKLNDDWYNFAMQQNQEWDEKYSELLEKNHELQRKLENT